MPLRPLLLLIALVALLTLGASIGVHAQRGGSSFEVSGVEVDASAPNAEAARQAGWRMAQRKGWVMLSRRLGAGGGMLPDGTLDSIVSGIVVEREQISPTRYIARLGVRFDRDRAAAILGVSAAITRSPPLLLLPIMWSGGAPLAFERKSAWVDAWARFNTGNSAIDYVRPAATGPDPLLLNHGQINRCGRGWWRSVLAAYGAQDVVIPIVHIYRQWPGGPVVGDFQARFGPDNLLLTRFSLRVRNGEALPALLDAGIKRIDETYQQALSAGTLRVDPGLLARLPAAPVDVPVIDDSILGNDQLPVATAAATYIVQVDTPSSAAVDAGQASLRGVPGVRGVSLVSLALGGVSVLRVSYEGDLGALRAALEARGWQVISGTGALRITRPARPAPILNPDLSSDNSLSG